MSDVREVSEWKERMQDAINDTVEAMRLTDLLYTAVSAADIRTQRRP